MTRKRNNSLGIWLSDEELIKLKRKMSLMACSPGSKRSAYIRKCILEKEITVIPGIRDLIIEIKRIGNNLNQITRLANEGSLIIPGDNLKNIREDLKEAWEKLAETLKKI